MTRTPRMACTLSETISSVCRGSREGLSFLTKVHENPLPSTPGRWCHGRVDVVFRRISDRQYGIGLVRDGVRDVGGDVAVRIAPGDARVPHDLVHFVVEEQARLPLGIFG